MRDAKVGSMLLAAMLLSTVASAQEVKSYEIVLDRHVGAGTTFRAVSRGTKVERLVVTVDGVILEEKTNEVAVDLDASAEILEVDDRGRPKKAKLVIERFASESGGKRVDVLARGTEVALAVDGRVESYSVAGEPMASDVESLFRLVNVLPTTDESDDAVFGTKQRKRVGDSWPIDAARAAESFREPGLTIRDEGVTGEATLVGIREVDGREVMTIDARIVMEGIGITMPEGFEVVEGRLEARSSGTFPVDVTRAKLDESLSGAMAFTANGPAGGPGGPPAIIRATGTRTRTTRFIAR